MQLPMSRAQLELTEWATEFREDAPVSYAEALRLASMPGLQVEIEPAKTVMHEPCFAIIVSDHEPEFWMSHKPTREAAAALCRQMGWEVA